MRYKVFIKYKFSDTLLKVSNIPLYKVSILITKIKKLPQRCYKLFIF